MLEAETSGWSLEEILRESRRWVWYPRSAAISEDERLLLSHPPDRRGASRVWRCCAAGAGEARGLVEAAILEARVRGGDALIWHTGDGISPPGVETLLAERGFTLSEELEVLAFGLWDGVEPRPPRLGRTEADAKPAQSVEELREAGRVEAEVFGRHAPSEAEIEEFARELPKLRDSGCSAEILLRFLARAGGEAIAASGLQVRGGVGRLWGSGTVVRHRGRGAYRALVRERCETARARGASLMLAKANASTSATTLRRAGFRAVGGERRYVLRL